MKFIRMFNVAALVGAIVLAFAFKADVSAASSPTDGIAWFQYEGPAAQTDAQIKDHLNYFYRPGAGTCTNNGNVCAVQYNYTGTLVNGKNPDDFPAALEARIAQDRNDLVDYPEITELP